MSVHLFNLFTFITQDMWLEYESVLNTNLHVLEDIIWTMEAAPAVFNFTWFAVDQGGRKILWKCQFECWLKNIQTPSIKF